MIDFYDSTIGLHINGRAEIVNQMANIQDPLAERWVLVSIDEAYIQCSKHIPRLIPTGKHIATIIRMMTNLRAAISLMCKKATHNLVCIRSKQSRNPTNHFDLIACAYARAK